MTAQRHRETSLALVVDALRKKSYLNPCAHRAKTTVDRLIARARDAARARIAVRSPKRRNVMTSPSPVVGDWYRRPNGALFEIVAIDRDDGTIEVQHFDGTVEEFDLESWEEQEFEEAQPPEDWTGSVDVEPEDYEAEREINASRRPVDRSADEPRSRRSLRLFGVARAARSVDQSTALFTLLAAPANSVGLRCATASARSGTVARCRRRRRSNRRIDDPHASSARTAGSPEARSRS